MEAFGLNPTLLIAQLVSFAVLFFVLNKFLFKKIRAALEDRRASIKRASKAEQIANKKVLELEEERKKLAKNNQNEARAVILEAQKQAEKSKKEIIASAETKAKKIVEQAREKTLEERALALEEVRQDATTLARKMATKILMDETSDKTIERSIAELEHVR